MKSLSYFPFSHPPHQREVIILHLRKGSRGSWGSWGSSGSAARAAVKWQLSRLFALIIRMQLKKKAKDTLERVPESG